MMKLTMPRYDHAQVIVIGDVMLDRYWHGPTARISPEAPVPVVSVKQIEDRPGGAANVALNIAALGAGANLLAITGNDEAGKSLRERLEAADVYCDFEQSSQPTITKLRVVSRQQQLLRMDFEENFAAESAHNLAQKLIATLDRTEAGSIGAIILSDYNKGSLQDCQQLIAAAKAQSIPVLVDPKGSDFAKYRGATLLTPNLNEFELVVGPCSDESELVEKGLALIAEFELQALLITRGEQGMTLLAPEQAPLHLPARAREVFDVTGAGDTVISVLASSIAAGEPMANAVALANIAAGIVVAKLGTAAISAPELRRAVMRDHGSERGVLNLEQLQLALQDARAAGEKIVMTNGCFDIIHAGHVGYLEQARQLGDRLVVAINSDASISRLKGPSRPINPVDRRAAVLSGLEAVDWVISFDSDTPEHLLEALRPDVLAKGGDYGKEGVVGWEFVESYGGEVAVLDLWDKLSTTAIVEKIQTNAAE